MASRTWSINNSVGLYLERGPNEMLMCTVRVRHPNGEEFFEEWSHALVAYYIFAPGFTLAWERARSREE